MGGLLADTRGSDRLGGANDDVGIGQDARDVLLQHLTELFGLDIIGAGDQSAHLDEQPDVVGEPRRRAAARLRL